MSDTSRNDEVMKYCFGDDSEFVAAKHYERLQRELAEAREDAANQRRLADLALAHRDEIIKERDILELELSEMCERCEKLQKERDILVRAFNSK